MYSFKILQNCTRDFFHSSTLVFDKKVYLFNCCDGTQRNALEQGLKFTKVSNIFFNSSHTDAYTGTYGFLMSRNEQISGQLIAHESLKSKKDKEKTVPNDPTLERFVKLWGPPDFHKNFQHCRHFFTEAVFDQIYEYDSKEKKFISNRHLRLEYFEDENVKIYPICTKTNKTEDSHMIIDSHNSTTITSNHLLDNNLIKDRLDFAMSYVCIPHLRKPTFYPEKAKALGLKPGPNYSKLQKGESVFLENGMEIKPEDVLGKQPPASCVGIFYSPSEGHASDLLSNETLKYLLEPSELKKFSIVVHIVPKISIYESKPYQEFLSLFDKDTIHLVDCKETNRKFLLNQGKNKIQGILNKVEPRLFNPFLFPKEDTHPLLRCDHNLCDSGFEYQLYPLERRSIVQKSIFDDPYFFDTIEYKKFQDNINSLSIEDNFLNHKDECKEKEVTLPTDEETKNKLRLFNYCQIYNHETAPTINFLGTTSMKPGKYRNVSSILVQLSQKYDQNCLLLDCGEGTFQQIYEYYGNIKTNEILMKLKVIFLTHKHGDHMLGTMKILSEIDKLRSSQGSDHISKEADKIYVIAPKTIMKWLENSISLDIKHKDNIILIDCAEINPNKTSVYEKFIRQNDPLMNFEDVPVIKDKSIIDGIVNKFLLGIESTNVKDFYSFCKSFLGLKLFSVEVFHCEEAFGCFLEEYPYKKEEQNIFNLLPWKISYSGDTRPCNNFLNFSINSSLLIHEATFDDDLRSDALEKMHSTFKDGIEMAQENNSWRVALTHFSPRYIKATSWKDDYMENKVFLSHDCLSCKLSDFDWAYKYGKNFDKIIELIEDKDLL